MQIGNRVLAREKGELKEYIVMEIKNDELELQDLEGKKITRFFWNIAQIRRGNED